MTQQNTLFALYHQRLKALMDLNPILQYNLQNDDAINYMRNEQMEKYRIDRIVQVIKDTLLNQKQKIIIRALTKCQQLQSQVNKYTQSNCSQSQSLIQNQFLKMNATTKESYSFLNTKQNNSQKEVPVSSKSINSSTKINNPNNPNNPVSPKHNNINIYQKLLQDKIIQIKQFQRRQNVFKQQIANLKKLNKQLIFQKQKQKQVLQHQNKTSFNKNQSQSQKKQKNSIKLSQGNSCNNWTDILKIKDQQIMDYRLKLQRKCQQIMEKQNRLKQLQKMIDDMQIKEKLKQRQMKLKQLQYIQKIDQLNSQNKRMIQKQDLQSQLTKKIAELQRVNKDLSQSKSNNNLKLIAELKNEIVKLQAELMNIQNNFELIKEHFTYRLKNQIQKMKRFHQSSKQYIKGTLNLMKQEAQTILIEAMSLLEVKYKTQKNNETIIKRLNEMDNQIDYFIENHLTTF